jgi:TPR repeat protein
MPATPARVQRDRAKASLEAEAGKSENEDKFFEFQVGCNNGRASACNALGEWYQLMRNDDEKALDLYGNACIIDRYPQACLNLGKLFAMGSETVKRSYKKAIAAYRIGCDEGNGASCADLSEILVNQAQSYALKKEYSKSQEMLQSASRVLHQGCEGRTSSSSASNADTMSNAKNCGLLSILCLKQGHNFQSKDDLLPESSLVSYLEKACSYEHAESCMALSLLYRQQYSTVYKIAKDNSKALEFHIKAGVVSGMEPTLAKEMSETKARKEGWL